MVGTTFEEIIGRELDRLYRAAVFLSGGEGQGAERRLTSAILSAFQAWCSGTADPLPVEIAERQLVRETLRSERGVHPGARSLLGALAHVGRGKAPEERTFEELVRAAAKLRPEARVAFWYAVVERRRYADIATLLERSTREVAELVREGQLGVHEALNEPNSFGKQQRRRSHGLP